MKFSTREDIDAPIEAVFEMLCAFETYERAAMRRGAEVQRLDDMTKPGKGATWFVQLFLRGKERKVKLSITDFEQPEELVVSLDSKGITGAMGFELIALSRTRTRMLVGLEIRPETLPARLLIQSMKLTKVSLSRKYKERVAEYVAVLQDRFRESA